jgi:hypothetical protein
MTRDDMRAADKRLSACHPRFAPLFGKDDAHNHAYT